MRQIKWSNIPIPQGHVIPLVIGVVFHMWRPLELWRAVWQRQILGWVLLLAGILLVFWATMTFKQMDFEKPTALMRTGPYTFSRNPMYVAWTLIYLAITLLVNTGWLFILFPVSLLIIHFYDVRREEHFLEQNFGEEYRQYRARVRRYL